MRFLTPRPPEDPEEVALVLEEMSESLKSRAILLATPFCWSPALPEDELLHSFSLPPSRALNRRSRSLQSGFPSGPVAWLCWRCSALSLACAAVVGNSAEEGTMMDGSESDRDTVLERGFFDWDMEASLEFKSIAVVNCVSLTASAEESLLVLELPRECLEGLASRGGGSLWTGVW